MEKKSQVMDYMESNFTGIGFQELHDLVIKNKNCVFCGACTTLCPRIGLNEKEPTLLEYDPECSNCYKFCPRSYFPENLFKEELFDENVTKSYALGYYQKLIAAKCSDAEVLKVVQNGGVVSSLLIHALETGLIDGVLLTDRDDNWYPKPVIARTKNEILACSGSKYTIAPTLSTYKDAISEFKLKKLAFVGMPCQIQAVRKFQLLSPLSEEYGKFKLIIGLFCFSNYSYDLINMFIPGELGIPISTIKKIDVSNGKFCVFTKNGTIKEVPIQKTKKYNWASCQYCKDYTAEIADISVGSVGVLENDWNSVILRTDIGTKFFNDAIEAKKIITSDRINQLKIEKESLRKKTKIMKIDNKVLAGLQALNIPDFEIKTYTTLMSLGNASGSILSKVLKTEESIVSNVLNKLEEREWITANNGYFTSNNPSFVIKNEVYRLRKALMEKIQLLKTDVLPNLDSIYVKNNYNNRQHEEDLNLL